MSTSLFFLFHFSPLPLPPSLSLPFSLFFGIFSICSHSYFLNKKNSFKI